MANAKINTANAVKEINNLINSFNQLLATTNKVGASSAANFRKVETAMQQLKITVTEVNTAFNKLEKDYANLSKSQKNFVTQTRNLKNANKELIAEVDKLTAAQNRNKKGLTGMLSSVKALIGAFGLLQGAQIFANLLKNAYELTKQFDSLAYALERITQDSFDAAVSQRFLLEITQDFGVELVSTAERWIKFYAASKQAGLSLKDTEDIFRSMTKAAGLLGLATDELSSVYLALEQMMSKGKVTTEELRRQLGERLPGAIGIMAAAVGVNITQLDEMLKKGEILSAEVLPKFAKALELAYGIDTLEKVDTLIASQNRLTNAWQTFVKNVTEGESIIKDVLDGLATLMKFASNMFATEEQRREVRILERKQVFFEEVVKLTKDRLDKELGLEKGYANLRAELDAANLAVAAARNKSLTDEEQLAIEERQRLATSAMIEYNDNLTIIQRQYANEEIEAVAEKYEKYKKIIDDAQKVLADKAAKGIGNGDVYAKSILTTTDDELEEARKTIIKYQGNLVEATAALEVLRKLKDESKVAVFEDEEEDGGGPGSRYWIDYTAPETVKWYKELIAINNRLIDESKDPGYIAMRQKEIVEYGEEIKRLLNIIDWDKLFPEDMDEPIDDIHILKQGIKDFAETLGVDGEKALEMYLAKYGETFDGIKAFHKTVEELHEMAAKNEIEVEENKAKMIEDIYKGVYETLEQLALTVMEAKLEAIEKEIEYETDKYDRLIDLAFDDDQQRKRLEYEKQARLVKLAQEKEKLEKKQFLMEQGFKIAQIALETALAIFKIQALASTQFGIPLVGPAMAAVTLSQIPFVIGGGAVAAATILAQTIPKFEHGVDNLSKDTIGMINDGGKKEYIERDGRILSTDTKNAIVDLKRGDTVYTDFEDMINSSMLLNGLTNGKAFNEFEFSKLGGVLKNAIDNSLGKAKFNNNIKINTFDSERDAYRNKLSSWN